MLEIIQHFEQAATQFNAVVLVGIGITAVLLGLFIWLGGLGLRKQLLIVVGTLCGGLCAFLASRNNIILIVFAAALGAVIAIKFEKIFLAVLAGALAVALSLAIMTKPYINRSEHFAQTTQNQSQTLGQTYTIQQTMQVIKAYARDLGSMIKHACPQMPPYNWLIILALAVIFSTAGFFLWPIASALCYAALGTIAIFLGMTMLLLFKGSAPLTAICTRTQFFMLVFAAMVIFGTLEQLILCKYTTKKSILKKQQKTAQQTGKAIASWRTS